MKSNIIIIAAIFSLLSICSCEREEFAITQESEQSQTTADNFVNSAPSFEEMREMADHFSQTIIPAEKIRKLENLLIENNADTSQFSTRQLANLITQNFTYRPNTNIIEEFDSFLAAFSKKDFNPKTNEWEEGLNNSAPREKAAWSHLYSYYIAYNWWLRIVFAQGYCDRIFTQVYCFPWGSSGGY